MIRNFFRSEPAGGVLLIGAALVALVWANTPAGPLYASLLHLPVEIRVGPLYVAKTLNHWINDGLMAVFFFRVGLEIKREVLEGEMSSLSSALLPGIAAAGGIAAPALVYSAVTWGTPAMRGWAIPAATDIAFALGVLALLGRRAPSSLKVFLLALAILDDLGAIVIIGVFYTADLSVPALVLGGGGAAVLLVLNRTGVVRIAPYVLVGIVIWFFVLKSGVHATLAGVVTALAVPLRASGAGTARSSPLRHLEHVLHTWVDFVILPVFAFANAGVSLAGLSFASLLEPVPLGIAGGLFVGKQAGVLLATWLVVRLGIGRLPFGTTWLQFYGVALLTGVGFTMSLFIGSLALTSEENDAFMRIGVLSGSLVSAVAGYSVLRLARPRQEAAHA